MNSEDQKRAVGHVAATRVQEGMIVGLGTGSTAIHFVAALALRRLTDLTCVATSEGIADLARSAELRVVDLDSVSRIDLTVDGADEIGPGLALIKGGGGALLREKLVWEASDRCLVIADEFKLGGPFGRFPLPVEVVAFGHTGAARRVAAATGVEPNLRMKGPEPFRTDGGNLIYDLALGRIDDPRGLGERLKAITGVVEHGLFIGLASEALIGGAEGVHTLSA